MCYHYGGDALGLYHYLLLAFLLYLDEGALYAVEGAADDLDGGAFFQLYLVGSHVNQLIIVGVAHLHEMMHLVFGDCDGFSPSVIGLREILKVFYC